MRSKETIMVFCFILILSLTTENFFPDAAAQKYLIPAWIKNVARWWASEQIDDSEFVQAIQYLVDQRVIIVAQQGTDSSNESSIPAWVKSNVGWWAEGKTSDYNFIVTIQYIENHLADSKHEICQAQKTCTIIATLKIPHQK